MKSHRIENLSANNGGISVCDLLKEEKVYNLKAHNVIGAFNKTFIKTLIIPYTSIMYQCKIPAQ